jgi:hypothetical protein
MTGHDKDKLKALQNIAKELKEINRLAKTIYSRYLNQEEPKETGKICARCWEYLSNCQCQK